MQKIILIPLVAIPALYSCTSNIQKKEKMCKLPVTEVKDALSQMED